MIFEKETVRINPDRDEYAVKFRDPETGMEYRRVLCGFSWPYLYKPGFAVVLTEDWKQDFSLEFAPRHFRVYEECESADIEELHRAIKKFQSKCLFESILGDREHPLNNIWQRYGDLRIIQPNLFKPITLDLVVPLIKKNTVKSRKTLHFGDESVLRRYLDIIPPEDIENQQIEQNPPFFALGYCLAELELNEPIDMASIQPGAGPRLPKNHPW